MEQEKDVFDIQQRVAIRVFMENVDRGIARMEEDNYLFSEATIQSQHKGKLGRVGDFLKQMAQKNLDAFHYLNAPLQFQTNRADKLRKRIGELDDNRTYPIRVSTTKTLRHGPRMEAVASAEEYIQAFTDVKLGCLGAVDVAKALTKDSFTKQFAALFDLATGDNTEGAIRMYHEVAEIIEDAAKKAKLKVVEKTKTREYLSTEPLLGGLSPTAILPAPEARKVSNTQEVRSQIENLHFYMHRQDKIRFSDIAEGTIVLNFRGRDLKKLFHEADEMVNQLAQLKTFGNYMATWMNSLSTHTGRASAARDQNFFDDSYGKLFVVLRMVNRINYIVSDTTASTYNAGMGNVKKAFSIIEDAL